MTTNNAGGPYNDDQAKHAIPEKSHQPQKFNGPYTVDDSDSKRDDWYDKFFSKECDRGYAKLLDNVDHEGRFLEKTILFRCPCERGETVNLPVNTSTGRGWQFSMDENKLMTLSPSIQQVSFKNDKGEKVGCGSHFYIKNGMVEWC